MKQDDDMWLNAALDGELGVEGSVEFQARLARDPALQAAWARQRALRSAIREGGCYHEMPTPLRMRISATVAARADAIAPAAAASRPGPAAPAIPRRRRFALVAAGALAGAMLGAGLTWRMLDHRAAPGDDELRIAQDAVAGHVRAAMTDRLVDVASSDQHTVKPWLAARLAYAPPVPELSAHGFELAGARRDVIDGQVVAVLVYRRRQHTISAFVRPMAADTPAAPMQRRAVRGFNVVELSRGAMDYWIVSDLNARDLADFAELLAAGG